LLWIRCSICSSSIDSSFDEVSLLSWFLKFKLIPYFYSNHSPLCSLFNFLKCSSILDGYSFEFLLTFWLSFWYFFLSCLRDLSVKLSGFSNLSKAVF
jgi:hypothetical protein